MTNIIVSATCFLASAFLFSSAIQTSLSTGRSFLAKGVPFFGGIYPEVTVLLLISSVLLVLGLVIAGRGSALSDRAPSSGNPQELYRGSARLKLIITIVPFAFFALFLLSPWVFHLLSIEDRSVEILSGVLLFAIAGIFVAAAPRLGNRIYFLFAAMLAVVFFLAAGEEFSWFSRWLNMDAQWVRQMNTQNEVNLHNMNTNLSEYLYYCGAFALLILFPFIRDSFSRLRSAASLQLLIPSREIALISAPLVAFNFDNWNTPITQAMFFVTCAILVVYTVTELLGKNRRKAAAPAAMFLGIVIIQLGFLALGHNQVRMWEIREYKEFLVPTAVLLYSMDMLFAGRRLAIPSETAVSTEQRISPSLPQETLDPL